MNNLLIILIIIVYLFPGLTGREYARIIINQGLPFTTKTDVNQILYGFPSFFKSNADKNFKPAWTITQEALKYLQENGIHEAALKSQTIKSKSTKLIKPEFKIEKKSPIASKYPLLSSEKNNFNLVWDKRLNLYDWQVKALDYWKSENYRGIIQAVTGSGKTRMAIVAIDAFLQNGKSINERWKVLIIVPTKDLMDQWSKNINEDLLLKLHRNYKIGFLGNGYKQDLEYVDILIGISNSVLKNDPLPKGAKGLIIGDEVHHYGTQNSITMLKKEYICRLGITAHLERISDKGVEDIIIPYFGSSKFHYGYEDAIEDNVIAPFEITFVIAEMYETEKVEMDDLNTQISRNNKKLIGKYPTLKNLGNDQFWAQINELARFDKSARNFRNLIYKRRIDVVKLESKLQVYNHLHHLIKRSKGCFGFTQVIDSANKIYRILTKHNIKCRTLDGSSDQKIRRQVMQSFKDQEIDMIIAPKLLDEGIDVPTANLEIILGRNSSMRQTIQRIGRVVRRKDENGKGYIVIISSQGTIEDPDNDNQEAFYEVFNFDCIKINKFYFPSQKEEMEEHFRKWNL